MKQLLSLLTAALLISLLTGCDANVPVDGTTLPPEATTATTPSVPSPTEETAPAPLQITPPVISEVMPDNTALTLGCEQDWIELHNPADTALSLVGFFLTDDLNELEQLPLSGTIPPGGYLTVILEDGGPLGLSELGETIYLAFGSETVSELTFPAAKNGCSFDESGACPFPTPGQANTAEGYTAYLDATTMPELVISEVMAANGAYYAVNYFDHYDLVEVTNTSNQAIDLSDYYLCDNRDSTNRYHFPEVTLQPGEFYVVLCSGDPSLGEDHAAFGLAAGDTVYLAKQGTYIDALQIPGDLQCNESFGRTGNLPVYLDKPTPGQANSGGSLTGIASPNADIAPGLYDNAVTVTLQGEGTIYYTTSGARPDSRSMVYDGPITISDDATTLRAICVKDGRVSPVANFTYVIGQEHDLPVLVISLPDSSMWGPEGLHTDVEADFEHEAVMTLFEDDEEKFSIPCGLCLHGNDSRFGAKKNYQLRFRAEYGASKLNYRLFETRDIDEFNSLLLKGGSEDWGAAMLRDELATSIADGATTLYTQAMKPVVVYLAGEYWGVHHLRERFSSDYVASHMNVSPESVDIVYSSYGYAQDGTTDDFDDIKTYTLLNNMTTNESYAYLCQRIDVTSLMDWYICRTYVEDTDTANIRRCRSTEGDGKWHWMYFDLDWSFYSRDNKPVSGIIESADGDYRLIHALLASEAGRDAFLKRYAYLMGTVLNEEAISARIDEILAPILSEMPRDRDRWGQSMDYWHSCVEQVRSFAAGRERIIINDLRNYFSLTDAQVEYYFGDLME